MKLFVLALPLLCKALYPYPTVGPKGKVNFLPNAVDELSESQLRQILDSYKVLSEKINMNELNNDESIENYLAETASITNNSSSRHPIYSLNSNTAKLSNDNNMKSLLDPFKLNSSKLYDYIPTFPNNSIVSRYTIQIINMFAMAFSIISMINISAPEIKNYLERTLHFYILFQVYTLTLALSIGKLNTLTTVPPIILSIATIFGLRTLNNRSISYSSLITYITVIILRVILKRSLNWIIPITFSVLAVIELIATHYYNNQIVELVANSVLSVLTFINSLNYVNYNLIESGLNGYNDKDLQYSSYMNLTFVVLVFISLAVNFYRVKNRNINLTEENSTIP